MGRVVVTEFISVDGVIQAPGDPNEFERGGWAHGGGNESMQFKLEELIASDAQLLGRTTYEGFAKAWPTTEGTGAIGEKMNGMPKFVASSTLSDPDRANTAVLQGDLAAEVDALKDRYQTIEPRRRGHPLPGTGRQTSRTVPVWPAPPGAVFTRQGIEDGTVLFSVSPQHQEVALRMTDFPLTGGCNCGAVRFEVTGPLVSASYCHCKRCQRRSGAAASANAHPAPDTFRMVAGDDRLRAWKPDGGGEKWFCDDCGSSLFGRNPNHADPVGIRMGAFDGDPGIRPSVRQFVAYAPAWEPIPDDGLPRHPESRHTNR